MNYIYDIEVNFKSNLINFYEWEKTDKIITLKKVPIYFVDRNVYDDILNMNIQVNFDFLNKLKLSNNICIFSIDIDAVCVCFNEFGIIDKISKLSLDEECEVLNEFYYKNKIKLKYKKLNKTNNYKLITRSEDEIIKKLNVFLDYQKEDNQVIDYLYYEWFEKVSSRNKYKMLYDAVNSNFTDKHQKLFDIIKTIKS